MNNKLNIEDFNVQELLNKNLIVDGKLDNKFYNAYYTYYYCLLRFLDYKLELYSNDRKIKRLELPIKEKKEKTTYNEEISKLKFIHIDNILHIERLDNKSIDILSNIYLNDKLVINKDVLNFIEKTYLAILKENNESIVKLSINYDFDEDNFNRYDFLGIGLENLCKKINNELNIIIDNIKEKSISNQIPLSIDNKGYDDKTKEVLKKGGL